MREAVLTCVLLVFRIRKAAFIPYVLMHSYTVKHICVWLQIRRAALLLFDMYVHLQLVLRSAYLRFTTSELLMVVCAGALWRPCVLILCSTVTYLTIATW